MNQVVLIERPVPNFPRWVDPGSSVLAFDLLCNIVHAKIPYRISQLLARELDEKVTSRNK